MSLEPVEVAEPRRTGRRAIDLFLAIIALGVSAISIFVAYHTSHNMERLVQANSWPFLQLDHGNAFGEDPEIGASGSDQIYFSVTNAGTGPAVLHSFELAMDGRSVKSDGRSIPGFLEICCAASLSEGDERLGPIASTPASRTLLAAGATIHVVRWPRTPENTKLWVALDQARQRGRIGMSACYCSAFDECWTADTNSFPPRPVESCPAG
jgi:hypothetical protein